MGWPPRASSFAREWRTSRSFLDPKRDSRWGRAPLPHDGGHRGLAPRQLHALDERARTRDEIAAIDPSLITPRAPVPVSAVDPHAVDL